MEPSPLMRIAVVDDGELARRRLQELLEQSKRCEIVASIANGEEAVRLIPGLAPDLVFLDIQMPGMSGIEVVESIGLQAMPSTIFVTAYNDYAVRAFDLAAVDYLLKPFDDERFEQALDRAEQRHRMGTLRNMAGPLTHMLEQLHNAIPFKASPYIERFAVELCGELRIVPVADVQHICASGHYAVLYSGGKEHLIRERMDTLEKRLDPALFFRIHRSAIVQLKHIRGVLREAGGDYTVRLDSGELLSVGRSRIDALERWMGISAHR